MAVYFIQIGSRGPIKIGRTKGSIAKRMSALQVAHHRKLRIIGQIDERLVSEKQIHIIFRAHRAKGEWFRPHPELLDFIRSPRPVSRPAVSRFIGEMMVRLMGPRRMERELCVPRGSAAKWKTQGQVPTGMHGRVFGLGVRVGLTLTVAMLDNPWCCPGCGAANTAGALSCSECDEPKAGRKAA